MKQIAIFQSDLHVGGIQKALINILNGIDYSRCEVDLVLFEADDFFELPQHENLHVKLLRPYPFLCRLVYYPLLRRFCPVLKTDKEYDVSIDFNSYRNECAVGALSVKAKKRVMWLHNDVEIKRRNEVKYRLLWHFFKAKLKEYDEFAAVSPGIIDGFRRISGIYDKKITAIPNHIDTAEIFRKMKEPVAFRVDENEYNLCSVGRLCHQKGYDILLGYMAEIARRRQDLHLYLIGDGPDRKKLEEQVRALGLTERVTMLGNLENPFPYMAQMDGFTLTSRYEGQGLVIWEAKTLGLELFLTNNLNKYNPTIPCHEDLVEVIVRAERREKTLDDLHEYNEAISRSLTKLLELSKP